MEVGYNGGELEYTGTQWRNYEPPEEAVREYPTNVFYSQEASYPIAKFTVWNVWALGGKIEGLLRHRYVKVHKK